jgi:phage-related protein
MGERPLKLVVWVGPTRRELKAFPRPVQRAVGVALYAAQLGVTPPDAKPLKGFGGAGVLELVEDHRGDTYRAVYTVRFEPGFTCCTCFRRNRSMASQRHRGTSS